MNVTIPHGGSKSILRFRKTKLDGGVVVALVILLLVSTTVLKSLAPFLFPNYFIYLFAGISAFLLFSRIDFDILAFFSKHLYVLSIFLLLVTLAIGQATRGAVRWIPLGPIAIQPSELVRPFLLLYVAWYLTNMNLNMRNLFKVLVLMAIPLFLILVQPSLGVSMLTSVGFVGVVLASSISKKHILIGILVAIALSPAAWFLMADYQKERVVTFANPEKDPYGSGYNSIQSMISIGSGKLTGRGLGRGVQTQLSFLPERHNDFIFASIAEELGFVGVILVLSTLFVIMMRLVNIIENAINPTARAFLSGVVFLFFFQVAFNSAMNMGMVPISGIPLPLVSAGGSSYVSTMISLGVAMKAKKA